jgi:Na+/H+-translocating membrane pyrophosphatase
MGKLDADVLRRTLRIEETLPAVSAARSHLISSSSSAAVLAAMAIPALASGQELRTQVGLLDPTVVWSGAIGAVLVLAYAGACVRAAVRAGRNVALEVDRQLRRFPKESGAVQLPSDFSPSYRACVDSASRGAFEQLISHLGMAFLVPSSLALLLRVWYRGSEGVRAAEGLMSFVLLSSIVGLAAALALDFSRATLSAARRAARSADSSEAVFVAGADGTGEVLAFSAAPATQVSIALFAALALAAAPFMN